MSRLTEEYQARAATESDMQVYMPILISTVLRYPKCQVTELGVRTGNSTSAFLAGAELVEGHVWSVDNGHVNVPPWWHETGLWDFTAADDMAASVVPRPCDLLFIDTSHDRDHTLAELRKFVPSVRPGGVVLLHDTLQWWDNDKVWVALNDYRLETGLRWREVGFGRQGLGQIDVPG